MKKILVWLALVILAPVAAFFVVIRPEKIPDRVPPRDDPALDLDARTGWYELQSDRLALVTWSAGGGLRILDLDVEIFSHRLEAEPSDPLRWTGGAGDAIRSLRFEIGTDGNATGFQWVDATGESRFAPRAADPPYDVREIAYRNGDVDLSATLMVPTGPPASPAAVMIHGSGNSDRDNLWYMYIAHSLATRGVGVLLPDKRGCGKSGGTWQTASFKDFATDATAVLPAVKGEVGIDPGRVGLLGISQGGWIAPLAASLTEVAFVVNVSGTAVTPNAQLRHESFNTLRQSGLPAFLSRALSPVAAAVPKRRRPRWWSENGDFDPLPLWTELAVPALVIYGGRDEEDNVPVAESMALLEAADRANSQSEFTIEIYPDSGHALFEPGTHMIRQDFLDLLRNWIFQQRAR